MCSNFLSNCSHSLIFNLFLCLFHLFCGDAAVVIAVVVVAIDDDDDDDHHHHGIFNRRSVLIDDLLVLYIFTK